MLSRARAHTRMYARTHGTDAVYEPRGLQKGEETKIMALEELAEQVTLETCRLL